MVIVKHVRKINLLVSSQLSNALSKWKKKVHKPLEVQLFERERKKHSEANTS